MVVSKLNEQKKYESIFNLNEQEQHEYIFNLAEITKNILISEKDYLRAQKLLQQKQVGMSAFATDFDFMYSKNPDTIVAMVDGYAYYGDAAYPLKLVFSEEEFVVIYSGVPRATKSYHQISG